MKRLLCAACVTALMSAGTSSFAATITLDATVQTWISATTASSWNTTPRNTESTLNVFSGSSKASSTTANAREYGILQFNLAAVPGTITDAVLQLYMPNGNTNTGTITQSASFVPLQNPAYSGGPAGGTPGGDFFPAMTFSDYVATWQGTDYVTAGFGSMTFAGAVPTDAYYTSTSNGNTGNAASFPADLAYLQGVQGSSLPHLGLLLNVNSNTVGSQHAWANSNAGFAPQLVVTYTPTPEPSTLVLAGLALVGLVYARRRF